MDSDERGLASRKVLVEPDQQHGWRRARNRARHGLRRREGTDVGVGTGRSRSIEPQARHLRRARPVPHHCVDEWQPRTAEHEEAQQESAKQGLERAAMHQLR